MAFLFDLFTAGATAFGSGAAGAAGGALATSAGIEAMSAGAAAGGLSQYIAPAISGIATAGTAALLTDKPEIKFPEVKGPGKPTPVPGAPRSPSETSAVMRARMRPLPKSTVLTRPRSRSSGTSISRATLSGSSEE